MNHRKKLAFSLSVILFTVSLILLSAFSGRKTMPQEDLKSKYALQGFRIGEKMPVMSSGNIRAMVTGNDVAGVYAPLGRD